MKNKWMSYNNSLDLSKFMGRENQFIENITKLIEMDKYFTPDIEDIRVGYECEHKMPDGSWIPMIVEDYQSSWYEKIDEYIPFSKDIEMGEVRTKYLTKEQIEAEGWEIGESKYGLRFWAKKGNIILGIRALFYEARWLEIYREGTPLKHLFSGECKDINTFRQIIKLLNIK